MKLARGIPGVDLLVVELAALLHDILDRKYAPAGTDARQHFAAFFAAHKEALSAERAELVLRVVEHVSWTTETKLRKAGAWGAWHDGCAELHCVQDADRLDAIGAIGTNTISSLSATLISCRRSAVRGVQLQDRQVCDKYLRPQQSSPDVLPRPLYLPAEEDPAAESAVGHFHEKLVHVHER